MSLTLLGAGAVISAGPSYTGVLDLYPGAGVAYSVRRLSGSYLGDAIRVRRSSDNNEQDIGFLSNGNLNEAQLTSFVGVGDGFITSWYDQSGNGNNANQTNGLNQPKIVSAGVVNKLNSKPVITFDGINDFIPISSAPSVSNPTLFFVVKPLGDSPGFGRNGGVITMHGSSIIVNNHFGITGPDWYDSFCSTNRPYITSGVTTQQYLGTMYHSGTSIVASLNAGADITVSATIDTNLTRYGIGNFLTGYYNVFPSNNQYQEVILYPDNQTSNMSAIKANINSYYTIYP